jgi:hypothetical protein
VIGMMRVILRGAFPVPALAIALAGCAGIGSPNVNHGAAMPSLPAYSRAP